MTTIAEIVVGACSAVAVAAVSSCATIFATRKPAVINAQSSADMTALKGFAELSAALLKRMGEQDDTIQQLKGEVENLSQHVYSLENELRRNGLPIPVRQRPAVFSVVTGKLPQ